MEFKAKIIENKTLQIQCKAEVVKHEGGRQDVVIHAPALANIEKVKQVLVARQIKHNNGRQDVHIEIKDEK